MTHAAKFFPLPDTPMTAGEAERFARKMYRFMVGETFAGTVYITSGKRRRTYIEGHKDVPTQVRIVVNAGQGWRTVVRELSLHLYIIGNGTCSSVEHEWAESKMVAEVWKRGYLDGRLQDKPKAPPTKTDVQRARYKNVLKLIKQWESKRKRANNALKKLNTKRKYYEKQLG